MKAISKLFLFPLLFCLTINTTTAQRTTEIGFTGGAVRFYPDLNKKFSTSRNDAMDNGWGFSAGAFIEDRWKPKIHQIIEVNFLSLYSDVFLEYNPVGGGGYGGGANQVVWKNFDNKPFDYFTVSGGLKYFLNDKLYFYPGIEWARSLTNEIDLNKSTWHLKLAAGISARKFDVILEYNYGLRTQRRIYDSTIPLIGIHRNKFLQLKIQIPVYRLR